MKRENGFYWVTITGHDDAQVALFVYNGWYLCSMSRMYQDKHITVLSPRLPEPVNTKQCTTEKKK